MSEHAPCPSLADLLSTADTNPALRDHLAACARCRALRANALAAEPAVDDLATAFPPPTLGGRQIGTLRLGHVCSIAFGDLDEYLMAVVLEADDVDATVAPLSDETAMATDWDLLLDAAVLGYPAMAEVSNHGAVLAEQVHEIVAHLPESAVAQLEVLYEAALDSRPAPAGLPTGVPVIADADPRLLFQDSERERVRAFWQPAQLLSQVETFGELVRAERDQRGVDPAELADLLDEPGWLDRLEADELDLDAKLSVRLLLRLLDQLKISVHEGTARLVGGAVAKTCQPPAGKALQLARRRTGRRARTGPSREERQATAQRYVETLWREARRS